jgi:hypothetical protein
MMFGRWRGLGRSRFDDIENRTLRNTELIGDLGQTDSLSAAMNDLIAVDHDLWSATHAAGLPRPGKAGKGAFVNSDAFLPGYTRKDRLLFGLGALIYQLVIRRIAEAPMLSQIFTTFGLMILFRGIAQFLWKPDFRTVSKSVVDGNISLGGIQVGTPQLVAGIGAVLITAVIYLFLTKTRTGAALEATAADKYAARLMGIDSRQMFMLAWGLGAACAGIAGALMRPFSRSFPKSAPTSS